MASRKDCMKAAASSSMTECITSFALHGQRQDAALGLAMAKYVSDHLDSLSGKYVFIFQPAEEGCRGGAAMLAKR